MAANVMNDEASAKQQAAGSGDPRRTARGAAGSGDPRPTQGELGPAQRDGRGRFTKGNAGGPGNPFARKVAALRQVLVSFLTDDDLKHIIFVLQMKAEGGNLEAIKLLFQYVIGKPTPMVDPDRLDVDEWRKMLEQSRPQEEMGQVMRGLPAGMLCSLARTVWPCAVEAGFKQPLLAGIRRMDERDAKAAGSGGPRRTAEGDPRPAQAGSGDPRPAQAGSGDPRPTQDPRPAQQAADAGEPRRAVERPSSNGDNGRQEGAGPIGNGANGDAPDWWEKLVEEALAECRSGGEELASAAPGRRRQRKKPR